MQPPDSFLSLIESEEYLQVEAVRDEGVVRYEYQ